MLQLILPEIVKVVQLVSHSASLWWFNWSPILVKPKQSLFNLVYLVS